MQDSLNVWSLILEATITVQLVMLILLLASIISWVMIIQRYLVLSNAEQGMLSFEKRFWSGMDLSQLYRDGSNQQKDNKPTGGMENIFRAGFKEFMRLRQQGGVNADSIMAGAQRAMRVAYSREEEKLEKNLPFLATVGSVTPYIGPVWYGHRYHELIHRPGPAKSGNTTGGCARHRRGADCNRHGSVCRDTGSGRL